MMMTAPCTWPLAYPCRDCDDEGCSSLAKLSAMQRRAAESWATEFLWNVTNRVFGVCDVTLRPCAVDGCRDQRPSTFFGRGPYPWAPGSRMNGWWPAVIDGRWYNVGCACTGTCSCNIDGAEVLVLPGPVAGITEVLVDGVVVPPSIYELSYGRMLVRIDGNRWPACQDLLAPSTEPGTFEVRYLRGLEVPMGGQLAAGELACEFAKLMCEDGSCRLPQRIQTITREGVTVGFLDQFENLKEGGTGIWAIDSWIASVNRSRPSSSVRSVDVPSGPRTMAGRTTWPSST